ncbi:MAG: IS110 family transposase [Selenomonadaceae bacterium]|nr:IS110 family transposase [Selenomonadaceae bacterium]
MNAKSSSKKNQVVAANIFEREELVRKVEEISKDLRAYSWKELETHGKFAKNDKISFISDNMLVAGCDIGSEKHYLRAIDTRGRELSAKAFPFSNTAEGFASAKAWLLELAARHGKTQIVVGLEPTGHYWFCLAAWLVSNGISVVQVNPYAVKQTKELEDNSQRKDDLKDPKLIANLVKDGNYGMPYLPEGVYGDLRRFTLLRDQLTEDRIRAVNRLHRELTICFPEYKDAFGKVDGAFTMVLLKTVPFPADLKAIGADGIRDIWHAAKLRGRGYSRAEEIIRYAEQSVGLQDGVDGSRTAVIWFAEQIASLDQKLAEIEEVLRAKCHELPCAENLLEIPGVGGTILAGIVAEMGDLSRFDTAKEIQKLSGLGLVACSSGKHKGETKISHRGRKRLRYWLFQAAKSVTAHTAEFKELHAYYTTRENNPLKKMQSLVVIACKLLRIIFAIFKNGTRYDPEKMLREIRRQTDQAIPTAA